MGIIIDLIIVAIIALNVYSCYRKGLVNLAVGLIAVFAAIIISVVFYKPVTNIIVENTQFDETIENAIIENFTVDAPEGASVGYTGITTDCKTNTDRKEFATCCIHSKKV